MSNWNFFDRQKLSRFCKIIAMKSLIDYFRRPLFIAKKTIRQIYISTRGILVFYYDHYFLQKFFQKAFLKEYQTETRD